MIILKYVLNKSVERKGGVDWIDLAEDREQWWVLMNA
jgi:hypothetical protein